MSFESSGSIIIPLTSIELTYISRLEELRKLCVRRYPKGILAKVAW